MIATPVRPSRIARWVGSLSVLNRQPQGSAFNDSVGDTGGVNCTPTFPYHLDVFIPSNVLQLNYGKLSFFLRAFRRDLASVNTVTSASSSAASSGSSSSATSTSGSAGVLNHWHSLVHDANAIVQPLGLDATGGILRWGGGGNPGLNTNPTDLTAHTHDNPHTHNIPHTHDVTPTLVDGIWEGVVATGVTVKINAVDRTAALGGGAGFTTSQTELEVGQYLVIGQWNSIDLTPTTLGRLSTHLRLTGYIQST